MLALSLRTTSEAVLAEILDAWFAAEPSPDADDARQRRPPRRDRGITAAMGARGAAGARHRRDRLRAAARGELGHRRRERGGVRARARRHARAHPEPGREREPRRCKATESNPGGTNNYIPDAPPLESLGSGFVITGVVRAADGCAPLEDVRVQVWLATETGGEQDNRASVRTGEDGRYRIETDPTIPQFGEPNIHVGYDDGDYGEVFIRRVVDLDDERAVVDLTLARRG